MLIYSDAKCKKKTATCCPTRVSAASECKCVCTNTSDERIKCAPHAHTHTHIYAHIFAGGRRRRRIIEWPTCSLPFLMGYIKMDQHTDRRGNGNIVQQHSALHVCVLYASAQRTHSIAWSGIGAGAAGWMWAERRGGT